MDTDLIVGNKTPEGVRRGLANLVIIMEGGVARGSIGLQIQRRDLEGGQNSFRVREISRGREVSLPGAVLPCLPISLELKCRGKG